jgi:hypothetical protein
MFVAEWLGNATTPPGSSTYATEDEAQGKADEMVRLGARYVVVWELDGGAL